jgi:HEAT repeat protein
MNKMMMARYVNILTIILFIILMINTGIYADDIEDRERDTLRYGTDSEIAALLQTLKKNNSAALDDDLIRLAGETKNAQIKSAIIVFFSEREKKGLEGEAIYLLENRNEIETGTVLTAIDYLGKIKYVDAQNNLRAVLESDEAMYRIPAIRAIAKALDRGNAGDCAEYLINYYDTKVVNDDTQYALVVALGDTESTKATPFLIRIIEENGRPALTIAALAALSKISDDSALGIIIAQTSSTDANIRAAAVEALGGFSGSETEDAIIEAFRDSYYRTRIAAIKASAAKKFSGAVPYLKFRAENDEQQNVKDEALRALGEIGGGSAASALEAIFNDKKTSDRCRVIAAAQLVKIDAGKYAGDIIVKIDEAKRLNQKTLYNGLVGAVSTAKSDKLLPLAEKLFLSKDAADKAWALAITESNRFTNLKSEVRKLAGEKNSGLAKRAKSVLEGMGE